MCYSIEATVIKILEDYSTAYDEIDLSTHIAALELADLDIIDVILDIVCQLGIDMSEEDFSKFDTVQDLVDFVKFMQNE